LQERDLAKMTAISGAQAATTVFTTAADEAEQIAAAVVCRTYISARMPP